MLRLGLVSYLALVISAGPMFCCCKAAQLADLATPTWAKTQQVKRHSCPHCQARQSKTSRTEKCPVNNKRPSDPDKCPCQQDRGKCVVGKDVMLDDAVPMAQPVPFDAILDISLDVITAPLAETTSHAFPPGCGLARFRSCSSQTMLSMLQMLVQ